MTTVPRARTSLTRLEMRRALVDGHRLAFGVDASPERIACALAMLCEEHANGDAVWNFNLGNIDATADWRGDVFELAAVEVLGNVHKTITKRLRVYPDAACGARGLWLFLDLPRFRGVLMAMDRGDPGGVAYSLKAGGYYTGSAADYARAMVALYREVFAMGAVEDTSDGG